MKVRTYRTGDLEGWLRLRGALWSGASEALHREEMHAVLEDSGSSVVLFVEHDDGALGGFCEVSLRDWAEGCSTRPVGYLEGLHVDPDLRGSGAGRALVLAAEAWARHKGCREMASDVDLANGLSQTVHRALGFEEVGHAVLFRKHLAAEEAPQSQSAGRSA